MKIKTKYETRFYIRNKSYNFFLLPTIVFFYRKDYFFETGVYTPAFGITFKWLKFYIGFKIQKYWEYYDD